MKRRFFALVICTLALTSFGLVPVLAQESTPTAEATMETNPESESTDDEQIAQLAQTNPPPRLSERKPGITSAPCEMPGLPGEEEGDSFYCGIFTVPQNWDEPDGPSLDLAFMVAKATGESSDPSPLLYLAGGPGQSALSAPLNIYDKIRPTRDIVRLDQRGTGFSQRLGFEECLVLASQAEVDGPEIELLQTKVYPPEEFNGEETSSSPTADEEGMAQINQLCWQQFSAQGLDLNQFTTEASARDVIELIKALEYDSFNLHGISYGTRLAMTIMKLLPTYPDAPELRSVVLDSTFPPSIYLISSLPRNDHDLVLQLLDDCRADPVCREAYPNLEGRLGLLLEQLAEAPLTTDGQTVTLEDVASTLTNLSGTRSGFMPKMITELETGVLDTYLALLNQEIGVGFPEGVPGLDRTDPVQAFIGDAVALIGGNDNLELMFDFVSSVDEALAEADPQEAVQAYITENYTDESGDQLLEMLADLTAEEFANSTYVAQKQRSGREEDVFDSGEDVESAEVALARERLFAALGEALPLYNTIHCIEDIQFERFEDAVNAFNDLQFPALSSLDLAQMEAGACINWPVEAAALDVKDPISSTVPALILQGAYDTRTPVYMGKRADRELPNSTFVLVPQQGHEIWTNATSCAARVAADFVQNPGQEPDLSCLDTRRPKWALPDDVDTQN